MNQKILLYGVTGYTGKLCAQEMLAQGLRPLVAARSAGVAEVAAELGCEFVQFGLDDTAVVAAQLQDIDVVINTAGPFALTQKALVTACIATGTHYLDIAGEVADVQTVHAFDEQAREAGAMLLPGAGFGMVPTDIAAVLAQEKLPDATRLTLVFATEGGASRGTLKTVLKDIDKLGVVRRDGELVSARAGEKSLTVTVVGEKITAVSNPWRGDLFTAGVSTGIPHIETYSTYPGLVVQMMHGRFLWVRNLLLNYFLRFLPEGPSVKQLAAGRTLVWAQVANDAGQTAEVSVVGPEAYLFTARTVTAVTKRVLAGQAEAGFQTPAVLGTDLLREIEGVVVYENTAVGQAKLT